MLGSLLGACIYDARLGLVVANLAGVVRIR